jgi:hypothetical protein
MTNRKRNKGISLQKVAFVCTALAAVLVGAWFLFPLKEILLQHLPQAARDLLPATATKPPASLPEEKLSAGSEKQPPPEPVAANSVPAATEAEPPKVITEAAEDTAQTCARQTETLKLFFSGLDQKDYIKGFQLKRPLEEQLNGMAAKLSAKRPVVVRETDDLYTVLANTVHLFRILGRENLQLVKTMLDQEQERMEDIAAGLHAVAISGRCAGSGLQLDIPFDTAYDYAGFFLNTMGGRAYLFRRDSKTRLVASYYAVLMIDEANVRNQNQYGIDITGILPGLIKEIEGSSQLSKKEEYLAKLRELAAKYPAK